METAGAPSHAPGGEAGFDDADLMSYFPESNSDLTRRRRLEGYATSADCMASPCVLRPWGGGCNATCACVSYGEMTSATTCTSNAIASEENSWQTHRELFELIDQTKAMIAQLRELPLDESPTGGMCTSCTALSGASA